MLPQRDDFQCPPLGQMRVIAVTPEGEYIDRVLSMREGNDLQPFLDDRQCPYLFFTFDEGLHRKPRRIGGIRRDLTEAETRLVVEAFDREAVKVMQERDWPEP